MHVFAYMFHPLGNLFIYSPISAFALMMASFGKFDCIFSKLNGLRVRKNTSWRNTGRTEVTEHTAVRVHQQYLITQDFIHSGIT